MKIIVDSNGNKYYEKVYTDESELELAVCKYIVNIFGTDAIFLSKRKLKTISGYGNSIPDGFVLMFDGSGRWYIVEIELASHPLFEHIGVQINKFMSFMTNRDMLDNLLRSFYNDIVSDDALFDKMRTRLGDIGADGFVTKYINLPPVVSIIINEKTQELYNVLAPFKYESGICEFKTFISESGECQYQHDILYNKIIYYEEDVFRIAKTVLYNYSDLAVGDIDSKNCSIDYRPSRLLYMFDKCRRCMLAFYINIESGGKVVAGVNLEQAKNSPVDNNVRKLIYDSVVKEGSSIFNIKYAEYSSKHMPLYKKIIVRKDEVKTKSTNDLQLIISERFSDFYHGDLQKMTEVLSKVRVD